MHWGEPEGRVDETKTGPLFHYRLLFVCTETRTIPSLRPERMNNAL